jgi:hypothetical protein
MSKMDSVVPVKLDLNARFKFRCHRGIKCYTKCCSGIEILLTPYDILRLKNRLGITSDAFLSRYTQVKIDEKSSHPLVIMKMDDTKDKKCPFVTPEGCTVYSDRPANCRYYPIGQGTLKKKDETGIYEEEFYFFIKEPHCLGYREDREWTVESWRLDQGVDIYDNINREWKSLQLRKNLLGQTELDEKKQALFYIASYNIDSFRSFVFESNFLNLFEIEDSVVDSMRNDEVALMKFGFQYLKFIFMLEKTLTPRNDVIKKKKQEKT